MDEQSSEPTVTDVVHLGKKCVDVDTLSPTVRFDSGEEIEPELIVGADGAGSAVRNSLFSETELRYADEIAYRGLAETTLSDEMSHTGAEIWGSGVRFGYFPLNDRVYWFATMVASAPDNVPEMTPAELANRFEELSAPIPDLISMTDEEDIVRTPLMDLPALDTWSRENATLLGDAAHAMTPNLAQGSAQAMEDAIVLAQSVAESGTTPRAFSAYETRRKDRADSVVRQSWMQGRLTQIQHPILKRARNAAFKYTPRSVLRKQTQGMYAVDF